MCLVSIELNCTIYLIFDDISQELVDRSLNQFRFKKKIKKELI